MERWPDVFTSLVRPQRVPQALRRPEKTLSGFGLHARIPANNNNDKIVTKMTKKK